MKIKKTIISVLSTLFALSGCSFFQKEAKNIPETTSGMIIPSYFVEDITEKEIEDIKLEYSIRFPVPYTIEMSPRETRTETIEIKNTGINADTFVFETEYRKEQNKWVDFSNLPEPTYLKPEKKMTLTFTVNVPEDAAIGHANAFTLAAFRQSNHQLVGGTDIAVKVIAKHGNDDDQDGVNYSDDNCPYLTNPDQNDSDKDGIGDACEVINDRTTFSTYEPASKMYPSGMNNWNVDFSNPTNSGLNYQIDDFGEGGGDSLLISSMQCNINDCSGETVKVCKDFSTPTFVDKLDVSINKRTGKSDVSLTLEVDGKIFGEEYSFAVNSIEWSKKEWELHRNISKLCFILNNIQKGNKIYLDNIILK